MTRSSLDSDAKTPLLTITLAVMGQELPAVHYMIVLTGRATVPLAPYHLYGTELLAEAALAGRFCLFAAKPRCTGGGWRSSQAWSTAEQIEFCADLYLRAQSIGKPKSLSDQQITEVIGQLALYKRQQ